LVRKQTLTNISITGTSINTPASVAKEAPEDKPNNIAEAAMDTGAK